MSPAAPLPVANSAVRPKEVVLMVAMVVVCVCVGRGGVLGGRTCALEIITFSG